MNEKSDGSSEFKAVFLRLFRCMTESEQVDIILSTQDNALFSALKTLGRRCSFDPHYELYKQFNPEFVKDEVNDDDLDESMMSAWPADWPGQDWIELHNMEDPGIWLRDVNGERISEVLFGYIFDDKNYAATMAEEYLIHTCELGIDPPSRFMDENSEEEWTDEEKEEASASFEKFLKHWRETILLTLEEQNEQTKKKSRNAIEYSLGFPINSSFVARVVEEELEDFLSDITISPVPRIQEMRTYLIIWFASFLPEAFDSKLIDKMIKEREKYLLNCESDYYKCLKIIPIEIALFILKDDWAYLQQAVTFSSSGMSSLRTFIYDLLLLAMPRIEITPIVTEAIYTSFRANYFFLDQLVFLLAIAKDESQKKLAFFKESLGILRDESAYCDLLATPVNDKTIENPFYRSLVLPLNGYLLGRMSAACRYFFKVSNTQEILINDRELERAYRQRLEKHPGLDSAISFPEDANLSHEEDEHHP